MPIGPFDLNLRHLRAIGPMVELGSLSLAAARTGLSQPALTQGLAKLERQLGQPLFDRRAGGLRPTMAGTALAVRVEAALAHLATGARVRGPARGFARPDLLMTATQLGAFLAVADGGGFASAAQRTGSAQPSLHRAVRDLEEVLGVPLAERSGRGITITAAGRRLARAARLAAAELAAALAELAPPEHPERILIGAMPLSRALIVPRATAALLADAPRARVLVQEGSWRELVEPLLDGVIDLMVGALRDPPPPGLHQEPLVEDRLIVVGRAGHPLADGPAPDRERLRACGWITGPPDTPLRRYWQALFADGALPPAPVECGSVMTIRGILGQSDLLTLLSPDQVALELASGLLCQIGEAPPQGRRVIGVVTRAGWRPAGLQARFLDLLRRAAAHGSQENQ
jgi:DNA-binding transcriptional LysR family regulator